MKAIEVTKKPTFKVLKGNNEPSIIQPSSLTLITKNSETPSGESGADKVNKNQQKQEDLPKQMAGYLRCQRYDFF